MDSGETFSQQWKTNRQSSRAACRANAWRACLGVETSQRSSAGTAEAIKIALVGTNCKARCQALNTGVTGVLLTSGCPSFCVLNSGDHLTQWTWWQQEMAGCTHQR